MKKTMRTLTSLLVVLVMLVTLPISALADDNKEPDVTIDEDIGTNAGYHVTVAEGGSVFVNKGSIDNNAGMVGAYEGNEENRKPVEDSGNNSIIYGNTGTVVINNGRIDYNGAGAIVKPTTQGGYRVEKDESNTNSDATVEINNGSIGDNDGKVITNAKDGHISYNNETGTVETNCGEIGENSGNISENSGMVYWNSGSSTVTNIVAENGDGGTVVENYGTVNNVNGGEVQFNYGTVNNEGGTLYEYIGITDYPLDEEDVKPSNTITDAGTYYGVNIAKGQYEEKAPEGDAEPLLDDGSTRTGDYALMQKKEGVALDLSKIFKQDGYEVVGYEAEDENYNKYAVEGTIYNEDKPGWLTLLWGKIKEVIIPPTPTPAPVVEEEKPVVAPVKAVVYPTHVEEKEVQVGTIVRRNNQKFKVIEMDDGSILVATMGRLTKKDIEDMKAFLAKYFTAEQIEQLLSAPELLSDELIAKYFADNYDHISFRAAKNLFAQ